MRQFMNIIFPVIDLSGVATGALGGQFLKINEKIPENQ